MTTEIRKPRRPGRPKIAKENRRNVIKTIRFTEDEIGLLEKVAKKNSQEFSEWARDILLRAIK
jgi:hypothetical protein